MDANIGSLGAIPKMIGNGVKANMAFLFTSILHNMSARLRKTATARFAEHCQSQVY